MRSDVDAERSSRPIRRQLEVERVNGDPATQADKIEEASSALKERSLDDLMGTFGQFARSQPAAFFATAALAGFALSRFLKSSGEGVGRAANRSSS